MNNSLCISLCVFTAGSLISPVALAQPAFRVLAPIGTDNNITINAVSPDGALVLGVTGASGSTIRRDAATWSTATGIGTRRNIVPAVPGRPYTEAIGCNTGGTVFAYTLLNSAFSFPAPYQVQGSTATGVPVFAGSTFSRTYGISNSGLVQAGWATRNNNPGDQRLWRWSAAGGLTTVPVPPGFSSANAGLQITRCLSGDGNTVIGYAAGNGTAAYSWNAVTGTVQLLPGFPSVQPANTQANGISFDGSVIVGSATQVIGGGSDESPVRWTAAGIEQLIPGVAGLGWRARAVSGDGRTIIGNRSDSGTPTNFIWRSGTVTSIEQLMTSLGISTAGITFIEALDVSFDGTVIVGRLENAAGNRGFALTVPPIPSPCLADIAGGASPTLPAGGPDGTIDGVDFIAFINSFGTGEPTLDAAADVAGGASSTLPAGGPDGTIDGVDFIAFINAFGAGC